MVGEEKHAGTQDAGRGASRASLVMGIRASGCTPWGERDGITGTDSLTHASE
jgi:hypothetical protein